MSGERVHGRKGGEELLKALGIDLTDAMHAELIFDVNDAVKVSVTRYVTREGMDALTKAVSDYRVERYTLEADE